MPEAANSAHRVLYVSYNGIAEPLVRSQVLNYLQGLSAYGYQFVLLTYERTPLTDLECQEWRQRLASMGVEWRPIPSHRGLGPVSSFMDVLKGIHAARRVMSDGPIGLFHARSFIPAVVGRWLARDGMPLLNDIRGFWVDEKSYKGSIRHGGLVYRVAKRLEAWVLTGSDAIVSLSNAGRTALAGFPCFRRRPMPLTVTIPTCVDLRAFRPTADRGAGPTILGYVGSMSEDYLPKEMFRLFSAVRRLSPETRLRMVTRSDPQAIWALVDAAGIPRESVSLVRREPEEVPDEVRRFDIALSLIKPGFAKLASCPTKVGEYLASGIPVVSNARIGDLDVLIGDNGVGLVLQDLNDDTFERAAPRILALARDTALAARCRNLAERHFSLRKGTADYAALYQRLVHRDT